LPTASIKTRILQAFFFLMGINDNTGMNRREMDKLHQQPSGSTCLI